MCAICASLMAGAGVAALTPVTEAATKARPRARANSGLFMMEVSLRGRRRTTGTGAHLMQYRHAGSRPVTGTVATVTASHGCHPPRSHAHARIRPDPRPHADRARGRPRESPAVPRRSGSGRAHADPLGRRRPRARGPAGHAVARGARLRGM